MRSLRCAISRTAVDNPEFVLNQGRFSGAPILLAGHNFGCGSSRESAVWSLLALGIRCVIAESFGDIFFGNCFQNGVLPIVLAAGRDRRSGRRGGHRRGGRGRPADLPHHHPGWTNDRLSTWIPTRRTQLLEGLDDLDIGTTPPCPDQAFQRADRDRRPWVYLAYAGSNERE